MREENFNTSVPTEFQEQFGPPTTLDIVLAPIIVIGCMLLGILILSLITQPRWWYSIICPSEKNISYINQGTATIGPCKDGATILFIRTDSSISESNGSFGENDHNFQSEIITNKDVSILMNHFLSFQNNPISLIKISLPVLISLAFCPVTILLYDRVTDFFWPEDKTGGMPVINDVVAAFLMPAGLVYAVAFGFAFADVLSKRDSITKSLQYQIMLMRQTWELVNCSSALISDDRKIYIAKELEGVVLRHMADIIGHDASKIKGTLWNVIHKLQQNQHGKPTTTGPIDDKIMDKLFNHILELEGSFGDDSQKDSRNITILQWIFLELLGFITFFGIIMIKANSYRLELTMCMLTVFTISAFSYILADLDYSYHGTFKVSLTPFVDFVVKLQQDRTKQQRASQHIQTEKDSSIKQKAAGT